MELTNAEKAKIFAMYLGCKYIDETVEEPKIFPVIGDTLTCFELYPRPMATAKLILRPLSAITDEEKIKISGIAGLWRNWDDAKRTYAGGQVVLFHFQGFADYNGIHDSVDMRNAVVNVPAWRLISVWQELIAMGFAVNIHPYGQTPVEIGIAQYI